jgi:anaphase-promoting complex subunit 1
MASVTSLGIHQPVGLRHAIQEKILPEEAPPSSYSWEIFIDTVGTDKLEDELLTTKSCVIWSRGGAFRKSFTFDLENEPVTQALLTYFPTSDVISTRVDDSEDEKSRYGQRRPLARALVVFLKTQAHIYFLSGTSHIVHMPFEVESACAAPHGVIIQRKSKMDNLVPVSLKFPRVVPSSFVSSQPMPQGSATSSQPMPFSTEGLGKPRTLPLRLSSTLESMWQPPINTSNAHWPRLVCLTDPMLELGLVVTQSGAGKRRSSIKSPFLDPAEEILHIESVKLPAQTPAEEDLVLAVTVNRERSMYTVWRMVYLTAEDAFISRQIEAKKRAARRRSSMPPSMVGNPNTPLQPSLRESFGAPLPGKRQKKTEKDTKALDTALSSLDPDKEGGVARRQSRRVSSLLARADLSTSQDRSTFADPQVVASSHSRRIDSHGSQRSRPSGAFSGTFNHSLNSLAEAPIDGLLDELRAGGDFDGFHSMGLDDHEFDSLSHEILFTKIHSVPMDNANVRYSTSNKPARTQSTVFFMLGGPCVADDLGHTQLLIGIQDPVDKRLLLLSFHINKTQQVSTPTASRPKTASSDTVTVGWGQLRKAQGVVDSCKVTDGDESMILILSEDKGGQRECSLQAPWSQLTTIVLPLLFSENVDSLDYSGRHAKKEVKSRRSIGVGLSGSQITGLAHPMCRGVVDIQDREGKHHRIRIQLQPSSPQVSRVLHACSSVLPASYSEKMMASWWHIMQWRKGVEAPATDYEWSSLVILLFATFLALSSTQPVTEESRSNVKSRWEAMRLRETPNSSAAPLWMRNKGWNWLLENAIVEPTLSSSGNDFVSVHVRLAKQFLTSTTGQAAFGPQGYLATASGRSPETQRSTAWSIVMALHLLLEEQKLNIMSAEGLSPGPTDLRAILAQITRWLGWRKYAALYDLDLQAELPPYRPG